ncbi:hypothetical protein LUZ61_002972 [Rhynchospora tenuis]|uniref:RING-type E3 ubiquitin transferase n=1 Tax=Rhynchospora tenuis TaxID=198213 RepID=A0AAD6ES86_9POAL|nr:hypothetical protein LUZ61_002972 [Rhynchospora tenuis]
MNDDKSIKSEVSDSIQNAISEVMNSVGSVKKEQEKLLEVGSYLHRVSPSITELQCNPNPPPEVSQILQSLSNNVNIAKNLVAKCVRVAQLDPDEYMRSIIQNLQKIIQAIGDDLSKIPASAFEDNKYAGAAIGTIAQEMQNAQLHARNSLALSERQSLSDSVKMPLTRDPRLGDFFPRESNYSGPERVEPLYDSFFCPITKKIMIDPVTIDSGITYEKSAILELFEKQESASEPLTCPVTGMKMETKNLNTNVALKATIDEWAARTEVTRIRIAANELMKGEMVSDAINELKSITQKRKKNIDQIHSIGITKILTKYLESMDATIRCETLELLTTLIQDDAGKEIMGQTRAIQMAAKLMSSSNSTQKSLALSFLEEATKSEYLGRILGHTSGAILLLVTTKVNESADPEAAKKASQILKNMEKRPKNMKYMALNGYLDPLLTNLVEGNEEMQMEMVGYLSELAQKQDISFTVAQESRACEALIRLVRTKATTTGTGTTETEAPAAPLDSNKQTVRKAAFDVFVSISSHKSNAMSLVNAGVVPVMIEELFLRTPGDGNPFPPKISASGILANLLESEPDIDPEKIQVNKNGHKLSSHYTMYNFAHMLKVSMPEPLNINVIRILLALSTKTKPLSAIVTVARETEMIPTVIELLDASSEDLSVAAVKLLSMLCPHIGHTIADRLCNTKGQQCNLVIRFGPGRITEKHAKWANFLAKLPHQNLTFNLYLLNQGAIPMVVARIDEILHGSIASRYAKGYLEGLVGILVRFTTTMYDPEIMTAVMENNLMHVFNELLVRNTCPEEVQVLACTGIMNLSSLSISLSKPLEEQRQPVKRKSFLNKVLSKNTQKESVMEVILPCPVHGGVCTEKGAFCIVESGTVERLLGCLENENEKVVGAALGALSTLLEDKVDIEKGVQVIHERDGVQRVLRVLREHRQESIWYKAFWVIERCLLRGSEEVVKEISSNRALPGRLMTAFHSGDVNMRKVANNILHQLNRLPDYSRSFVSMEILICNAIS